MKLDLGCGTRKKEGFVGVDSIKFDGVDVVLDLGKEKWPWENDSVDEIHASHFMEHLTAEERVFCVNEMYRVMKKGAKATIVVPHWASSRAYGDMTHKWPPVSEFWFYYLNKEWCANNAPHSGYTCDFDATWGYSVNQFLTVKNQEFRDFALQFYKEAAQDIVATLVKNR
jgi:ubiquinone/menaquinone biosynthesis C-methylase UbiE